MQSARPPAEPRHGLIGGDIGLASGVTDQDSSFGRLVVQEQLKIAGPVPDRSRDLVGHQIRSPAVEDDVAAGGVPRRVALVLGSKHVSVTTGQAPLATAIGVHDVDLEVAVRSCLIERDLIRRP